MDFSPSPSALAARVQTLEHAIAVLHGNLATARQYLATLFSELSGIGRYALRLLSGLAALHPARKIYALGGDETLIDEAVQGSPWIERLACDWSAWSVRGLLLLPSYLRELRCKVYHCPYVYPRRSFLERPRW